MKAPRCCDCMHFNNLMKTCNAFPDKIPDVIFFKGAKHNQIIKGQKGSFVYFPKKELERLEKAAKEEVERDLKPEFPPYGTKFK